MQDNILMGTLSVRENLYFSAALRLPSKMTWQSKKTLVSKIIDELGLSKCADSKVNDRDSCRLSWINCGVHLLRSDRWGQNSFVE